MTRRFYGEEYADHKIHDPKYPAVKNIGTLYEILKDLWCKKTCAPRMAKDWSQSVPSLGQCSITSFLVQDIIGGEVWGIRLPDGNYHCFNVIGDISFDLTSSQFEKKLDYSEASLQSREVHFSKKEKYERYLLLKEMFEERCKEKDTV